MVAVTLGYNSLEVTLGVFETEEIAREKLLECGAEYVEFPKYEWKDGRPVIVGYNPPRLATTKKFVDYLDSKDLPAYSVGEPLANNWVFMFRSIQMNEICFGYDDD